MPSGPGVRVDTAIRPGDRVPPDYDPMIAKVMTVGRDRGDAVRRLRRALDEVEVTGIQTTLPFDRWLVRDEAFLRDASPEELAKYHAIYLLDVGRLDDRAVSNLERFVSEGGGLGIFAGENIDTSFYNGRFYKNGEGLFPLPLESFAGLEPQLVDPTADIQTTRHPLMAAFAGDGGPVTFGPTCMIWPG